MSGKVTLIGMDLGTHKTSVASSNGRRAVIPTAVGWPKDHIARNFLGADVVYGKELQTRRRALDIVRPLAKGYMKYRDIAECQLEDSELAKHKEALQLIVGHAVSETQPVEGQPVYGVIGAPSRATIQNKQVIIEAASKVLDRVFIVSEPFAVAYGMSNLDETLVVDIGGGTIDICPLYGTFPSIEEQRTIPLGGDTIDEEFATRLRQEFGDVQFTTDMIREIKERFGTVEPDCDPIEVTLSVNGVDHNFDVTHSLTSACESIVQPIVDALSEVIATIDPGYKKSMLSNIVLAGGGSQLRGLPQRVEMGLAKFGPCCVTKVYDHMFAGAVGALKLAIGMPEKHWDQLAGVDSTSAAA